MTTPVRRQTSGATRSGASFRARRNWHLASQRRARSDAPYPRPAVFGKTSLSQCQMRELSTRCLREHVSR